MSKGDMDSEAKGKQGSELKPPDFQRLLACLDPDSERASARYTQLRERLVRFARSHNEHLRAEELADNALDEIAKKPDLPDIRDLEQFAIGVLRMLLMAHKRKNHQLSDDLDLVIGEPDPEHSIVNRLDRERKEHCFVACMKHLSPSERRLIFEYHPNENRDLEGRRKQLAIMIGIQPGTLATRMNRLRNKLEKCCMNCYRRSFIGRPRPAA